MRYLDYVEVEAERDEWKRRAEAAEADRDRYSREVVRSADGESVLRRENARLREAIRAMLHAGVEMDDVRLDYVVLQMDRADIEQAREALAALQTTEEADHED